MAEMSEEDRDFIAVRIKHRGSCPYEKGHSDGEFAAGLFLGAMFVFGIGILIFTIIKGWH